MTARFKKTIMLYVAQQIPEKDVETLKQYFLKVDLNGNGTLTLEEMQKGTFQRDCQSY